MELSVELLKFCLAYAGVDGKRVLAFFYADNLQIRNHRGNGNRLF